VITGVIRAAPGYWAAAGATETRAPGLAVGEEVADEGLDACWLRGDEFRAARTARAATGSVSGL
jgi:hypothetical protein